MKRMSIPLLVMLNTLFLIVIFPHAAKCYSPATKKNSPPPYLAPPLPSWPKADVTWIEEKWGKENASISRMLRSVDMSLSAGKPLRGLLKQYSALLVKSPDDSVTRVGWAYIAYRGFMSNRAEFTQKEVRKNTDGALWMLRNMPIGGSREVYRLRFLLESLAAPDKPLLTAAQRLYKELPDDPDVKSRYGVVLPFVESSEENCRKAILLQNEAIQQNPANPNYYSAKARCYWNLLGITRRREDGMEAIRLYEKANLLFKDSETQASGRGFINRLTGYMKRLGVPPEGNPV